MDRDIQALVKKELKGIEKERKTYLFIAQARKYNEISMAIMKELSSKKLKGIYVTMNKTYQSVCRDFKKNKIKTDNILFIDNSTKKGDSDVPESKSVIYISSPESLTELSLAITKAMSLGFFDYIFIDSLTVLSIYNETKTVQKFSQYLLNKIKMHGLTGIIMSLDEKSAETAASVVASNCDKCVKI